MIRRPPRSTLLSLHDALPILARRTASLRMSGIRVPCTGASRMGFVHRGGDSSSSGPMAATPEAKAPRSEEHTSELQSRQYLVCRLLLEKKKIKIHIHDMYVIK